MIPLKCCRSVSPRYSVVVVEIIIATGIEGKENPVVLPEANVHFTREVMKSELIDIFVGQFRNPPQC